MPLTAEIGEYTKPVRERLEDVADDVFHGGRRRRRRSTGRFVAGLLTGAVLGTLAAALFAPDRGSDTRKSLVQQLSFGREAGLDLLARARGRLDEAVGEARQTVAVGAERRETDGAGPTRAISERIDVAMAAARAEAEQIRTELRRRYEGARRTGRLPES